MSGMNIETFLADDVDSDDVYFEIWVDNEQWAMIRADASGALRATFYEMTAELTFTLDELRRMLDTAQHALAEKTEPRSDEIDFDELIGGP